MSPPGDDLVITTGKVVGLATGAATAPVSPSRTTTNHWIGRNLINSSSLRFPTVTVYTFPPWGRCKFPPPAVGLPRASDRTGSSEDCFFCRLPLLFIPDFGVRGPHLSDRLAANIIRGFWREYPIDDDHRLPVHVRAGGWLVCRRASLGAIP